MPGDCPLWGSKMCGIAGIVGRSSANQLLAMDSRVSRRGPDAMGIYAEDPIRLSHRRLAILGLGDLGKQPAMSPSGRYVLAFNGEIYNHQELRNMMPSNSCNWVGSGDSETLAALLDIAPIGETVSFLKGMFAIAVWDREARELHLARDRFGIKPLYYAQYGSNFVFSSTADAVWASTDQSPSVSRQALHALMTFGHISGRRTLCENILEVLPGEIVSFCHRESVVSRRKFSNLAARGIEQFESGREEPLISAYDELYEALLQAVAAATISDVPVGSLLSGGVDSRLVAGLHAMVSGKVNTFTIGFPEADFDESTAASQAAKQIGSDHHLLHFSQDSALDAIRVVEEAFGEPFGDSSSIPMLALSELASRFNKVVVSGDGGDELFGGYRTYSLAQNAAVAKSLDRPIDQIVQDFYRTRAGDVVIGASEDLLAAEWTAGWESSAQLGDQVAYRMMLFDVEHNLPFGILHKVDRASMHFGLEVRPPLLSERVFDLAWRINGATEGFKNHSKAPLLFALERVAQQQIRVIPKSGLSIPLSDWLRGPLLHWAMDLLDPRGIERDGFFDSRSVQDLWVRHINGERVSYSLWPILMFQSWRYRSLPSLL